MTGGDDAVPLDPMRDVSTIDLRGADDGADAVSGRLTLVRAPHAATLARDARTLANDVGTQLLVPLLPEVEAATLGLSRWTDVATSAGLVVAPFAIRDMSVPDDLELFLAFTAKVVTALEAGSTVTVHCRAGLGRSGLVAASVLVHLGASAHDAIDRVRAARPGAVETPGQERFVHEVAVRCARATRA